MGDDHLVLTCATRRNDSALCLPGLSVSLRGKTEVRPFKQSDLLAPGLPAMVCGHRPGARRSALEDGDVLADQSARRGVGVLDGNGEQIEGEVCPRTTRGVVPG